MSKSPKFNLTNPIFHDDAKAREHLESLLWPDGPNCPRCGVTGDRITKLKGKSTRPGVHKCKDCRKPFTVTVGTVMERSKIPLSKWALAAQLMASSKKGMSAHQLHRMLGTTYETAWFLFHRLREAARETTPSPLGGKGKVVEADETYIGGKEKNKHLSKRKKGNVGGVGKQIVVSLVERGGKVRSTHVSSISAKTLAPVLFTQIDRASTLMTDEAGQYFHPGKEFDKHVVVNHSILEYVRGDAHTNTVEGYFSLLKRGITGSFHHVSEAHLKRYLGEFDFRYNTRHLDEAARADALLRGAKGKRLLYQQPRETAHT